MVKSVAGVNHRGLTDWLIQRASAVIMLVYIIGLFLFCVVHPDLAYYEWHGLFAHDWMKIATVLVVVSLLYHAWIGMWTIYTDYIKISWLRLVVDVLTIIALLAFFFQTLLILWSV